MDKKVNSLIKKYSDNELSLNKLVVSAFVHCNSLTVKEGYLASYIAEKKDGLDEDISILSSECSVEDVINIFELAIPKEEKTANGAVYTPKYIRDYIVSHIVHSTKKPLEYCLCADISCGCGAFLFTLLEAIHEYTAIPYKKILHHLYGIDISSTSIGRAKYYWH